MLPKPLLSLCLVLTLGSTFLVSCDTEEPVKTAVSEPLDPEMVDLLTAQGYHADDIYLQDGHYRIKGSDIAYSADMVNHVKDAGPTEEQQWYYAAPNGVYYSNSKDIRIYQDSSFPNNLYGGPLYYAARHWSNISPNINITFTSSRNDADVIATSYYDSNSFGWAFALFPSGDGNVGRELRINMYQPHNQSYGDKVALMVHELGHILSYRHTNDVGSLIPGTPVSDPQSVMNSSVPGGFWQWNQAGWSNGDRTAIDWAYRLY